MHLKYIDNLVFDIYIRKNLIKDINFDNKEEIEKYLKNLFKILSNKYKLNIEGFYDITIYKDKYYGIIIHFEKEELEYYDYYKNQVDMRLIIKDINFKYIVSDIPHNILNKVKIKNNNDNIYLIIKEELSKLEFMQLMEVSIISYN